MLSVFGSILSPFDSDWAPSNCCEEPHLCILPSPCITGGAALASQWAVHVLVRCVFSEWSATFVDTISYPHKHRAVQNKDICWRQCYSSWRSISTNIVYCVYLNVLDNLIWLCPAQFLSPLTTIVVIWRYISKIEFLKLNFITFIAQFPELCVLSVWEEERSRLRQSLI